MVEDSSEDISALIGVLWLSLTESLAIITGAPVDMLSMKGYAVQ